MLTKENKDTIQLPQEIKDAILRGYDIYITRQVKNGVVSAKITFHKICSAVTQNVLTFIFLVF